MHLIAYIPFPQKALLVLACACLQPAAHATGNNGSTTQTLPIRHLFGKSPLQFYAPLGGTTSPLESLRVTRLEYLLSQFTLHYNNGARKQLLPRTTLVDPLNGKDQLKLDFPSSPGNPTHLEFTVGIPREDNHSDPSNWPPNHPLHPTQSGLFWNWKGGYVFFALEGDGVSTTTSSRATFLYHLGSDPLARTVTLPLPQTPPANWELIFHADRLWTTSKDFPGKAFPAAGTSHSSEGDPLAASLADRVAQCFEVRSRGK